MIEKDKFFYCPPRIHFDMNAVLDFSKSVNATSFRRCKTKNTQGFWQIFCFDKKADVCGIILTKSNKIRCDIHKKLTND